jgi:putative sterol carrier protein
MATTVEQVFELITKNVAADPGLVKRVGGVYLFDIDGKTWTVDLKNGSGSVKSGKEPKADCTITIKPDDFLALASGKLNGQQAFMQGKLKLGGNMGLAMKLGQLFENKSAAGSGGAPQQTTGGGNHSAVEIAFKEIEKNIAADPSLVSKVNGVYQFDITLASGEIQKWAVDLKTAPGSVSKSAPPKADCTLALKEEDFVNMLTGKTDGQSLFMQGKLKMTGNMGLAMKLGQVVANKQPKQAKL